MSLNDILKLSSIITPILLVIITIWLNRRINRKTFIEAAKFNKEFEVYQELWTKIHKLTDVTQKLRPMLGNKNDEKEVQKKFGEAFNDARL